jgi:proteasome lid subunit RPN8/RPN11
MQVFSFASELGLMTLGWIHTHPSQRCFLSSVDLHTTLPYSILMPGEAVAVVCAPTDPVRQVGVFRLTDYGILYLSKCPKGHDSFHEHRDATAELYTEISSNSGGSSGMGEGGVLWDRGMGVQVVDRRHCA